MSEEVKQQEVQQAPAQEQSLELTVQDLAGLRSVIDVASTRGAFKANELEAVGRLYNKLNSFLEQIAKQSAEKAGSEQNG